MTSEHYNEEIHEDNFRILEVKDGSRISAVHEDKLKDIKEGQEFQLILITGFSITNASRTINEIAVSKTKVIGIHPKLNTRYESNIFFELYNHQGGLEDSIKMDTSDYGDYWLLRYVS